MATASWYDVEPHDMKLRKATRTGAARASPSTMPAAVHPAKARRCPRACPSRTSAQQPMNRASRKAVSGNPANSIHAIARARTATPAHGRRPPRRGACASGERCKGARIISTPSSPSGRKAIGLNGAFVMTANAPLTANRHPPTVEATQPSPKRRRKARVARPAKISRTTCMTKTPFGNSCSMMKGWNSAADCISPASGCPRPSYEFHSGTSPSAHWWAAARPGDSTVQPTLGSIVHPPRSEPGDGEASPE